ncbi:hypothetical protein LOK49_LG02G00251 [Camellia lanceoleosa]|uniref:Uncharacterized protein n=1 Tax=Camellia lanceoleosa TaxID=1840588 RepID=A0ACC0IHN3_9ERIC|nr:hypothetical protein LOK49_LG02G00251 [Camellia lanceoleosa]
MRAFLPNGSQIGFFPWCPSSSITHYLVLVGVLQCSDIRLEVFGRCMEALELPEVTDESVAGVVITPWKENIFLFQFNDLEDRLRVLHEAPWSVMGSLLVLQPLPLEKAIDELDFRWSPFWVQCSDIRLEVFGRCMEALELPEVTDECTAGVVITPWKENIFLFQFNDLEDRLRVLQEAPWSVMGSLLVLQLLPLKKAIDELDFRWSPFWVQVHSLPCDKMTRAHGEVIGNRIGQLVEIEAPSDGLLIHRNFLRLRVEVDVSKPLLQGFILYRRDSSGPVGNGLKVYYKYERLSEFCYDCGCIRHDKLACKFVSREEGLHSGYGPSQRTGPVKNLSALQSSIWRPTEDLRPGKDQPEPHLHIPISCMATRREGAVRDEASGSATPTPHQLATNVGVRYVQSRVVELGANKPFQSENPRPCSPVVSQEHSSEQGPSLHDSGLLSGQSPFCNSNLGPTIIEGEAPISLNPILEQSDLRLSTPYFVIEPSEVLPLISQPMGSTDHHSISVQELNPSPSPERTGPSEPSIDLCISTVFNNLSLKRPLGDEDICDPVAKKKFKGAVIELDGDAVVSQALCVFASKPKARILARRGRCKRQNSLVDIQVQTLPTEATQNPRGTVSSERPRGISVLKVHEVIDSSRKFWDESKLRNLVSGADCEAILSILVSVTNKNDTLLWHHDSKGCYMVKSGYHEAMNQAHLASSLLSSSICWSERVWLLVWNLHLPPKLKHFLWKIYHNALATRQNLFSRQCAVSARCPVCLSSSKSLEHLLFECDWSKRVWFGCDLGLRCDNRDSFSTRDWFGKCFESLGTSDWGKSVLYSMVWVAWTIWKGRNKHLFNHSLVDLAGVIAKAKRNEVEFLATCLVPTSP